MRKTKILIIDDNQKLHSPLIIELIQIYGDDNVILINDSQKALDYILSNYNQRMIIILDVKFPANEANGHEILQEIRELTNLIPVIIWSGAEETSDEYIDFINKKTFYFIKQTEDISVIIEKVHEAEEWVNSKPSTAIEDWINSHDEKTKNKLFIISKEGKEYSMNDVLNEIRKQTEFGLELENKILKLAVDFFYKNNPKK